MEKLKSNNSKIIIRDRILGFSNRSCAPSNNKAKQNISNISSILSNIKPEFTKPPGNSGCVFLSDILTRFQSKSKIIA